MRFFLEGGSLLRKVTIIVYILIIFMSISQMAMHSFTNNKQSSFIDKEPESSIVSTPKTYDIFIDLVDNILAVFEDGVLLKQYPIASGKFETPSPAGIWKIVRKDDWGEGFGGHWMGLNVPCPNI